MLQTSGAISLEHIGKEFEGNKSYKFSDYYGKDGVRSSGPIKFSDFYGRSNYTIDLNKKTKIFNVYLHGTSIIQYSSLVKGVADKNHQNTLFYVESISDVYGGELTMHNTYISFKSTVELGENGGFKVRLKDSNGYYTSLDILMRVSVENVNLTNDGDCWLEDIIGVNSILEKETSSTCELLC